MSAALAFAGASMGIGILQGLFGYMAAADAAEISESRGRMLKLEADTDAVRFGEEAQAFKATQKMRFLKSGVTLEGSPLEILDETTRNAEEQISAIRARGAAQQADENSNAESFRNQGRAALLGGISGAASTGIRAGYSHSKSSATPKGP